MANLNIIAVGEWNPIKPMPPQTGYSWSPVITLSIQEENGKPVTGLRHNAFEVWRVPGFDTTVIGVNEFKNQVSGYYILTCQGVIPYEKGLPFSATFIIKVTRTVTIKPKTGPALKATSSGSTLVALPVITG